MVSGKRLGKHGGGRNGGGEKLRRIETEEGRNRGRDKLRRGETAVGKGGN